jgi:hypothetical protein
VTKTNGSSPSGGFVPATTPNCKVRPTVPRICLARRSETFVTSGTGTWIGGGVPAILAGSVTVGTVTLAN